ncbi:MAG TPA: VOC family protein [Vicinamibacterales bacterium]|nr:VOC family protein [Vicinamibacterales bacterium]
MHIDHVAIAVRSLDAAADRLQQMLGYVRKTAKVTNTRQKVDVMFLRKEGSLDIKLISPSDDESPLWDFVRKGGGLHHLCFKVPDVAAACAEVAGKGARILSPPAPGEAFNDHDIAFCFLGLGLNVEFIDTDERRGAIDAPPVANIAEERQS